MEALRDMRTTTTRPKPEGSMMAKAVQRVTMSILRPIRRVFHSVCLKTTQSIFSHVGAGSAIGIVPSSLLWTLLTTIKAQQIDLRFEQIRFIVEQLGIYNSQNSARDITVSARYIR